jgi:hypothetical protein
MEPVEEDPSLPLPPGNPPVVAPVLPPIDPVEEPEPVADPRTAIAAKRPG